MRTWILLAIVLLGCGAGPTRASETPADPETGEPASSAAGAGVSEQCTAVAAVEGQGDCDAFFEGAYVDRATGRCAAGFASGCHATFPFDTLEACRAACEPGSEPAPARPHASAE